MYRLNTILLICTFVFMSILSAIPCQALTFPGLTLTEVGNDWHEHGLYDPQNNTWGGFAIGGPGWKTDVGSFYVPKAMDLNKDGIVSVYGYGITNYGVDSLVSNNCTISVSGGYSEWRWIIYDPVTASQIIDIDNTTPTLFNLLADKTYGFDIYSGFVSASVGTTVIDSSKWADYSYRAYASSSLEFTSAETPDAPAVPEPSTILLLGGGLAGLGFARRRTKK